MTAVYILALFTFLVAGTIGALRVPPLLATAVWFVVPLALMPLWLENEFQWSWLHFAKTWSVPLGCAWLSLCAAWPSISRRLVSGILWAILATNILEAVAWDAVQGFWLNAIAGILLIAASLPALAATAVGERAQWHAVTYDLPWIWLLGYTLWYGCFFYLSWGGYAFGQHVAVLGAALAVTILLGRRTWLHARALTLGLYLVVYDTFFATFRQQFDTSSWQHPTVMTWFQVASLGLAITTCGLTLHRWRDRVRRVRRHVPQRVA